MNRERSRLRRNLEKQTRKQIIISLLGIGVVLFLLLRFGPSLIGGIGDIIFKVKGGGNEVNKISSRDYIEPPSLDPISPPNSDGKITVSGQTSYTDATIEIVVNDTSYEDIAVESDGKFKKENIALFEGDNTVKARVKKGDKASDFSNETIVKYAKSEPKIDISAPSDGQIFTKADQQITVSGKTDNPDNIVTVNGFRAIVNSDGSFSYYLKLNDGDNTISIEATNTTDKKTKKEIKVKYQP